MEKNNGVKNLTRSIYNIILKRGISGITSTWRVLPDFIIIGTVRSGSTSLYYNICSHPSILPASYDAFFLFSKNVFSYFGKPRNSYA